MNASLHVLLFFVFLFPVYMHAQPTSTLTKTPFTIGETITWQSSILGEERSLNVYLPHSYDRDSLKTYPVIYLLDGSADEDFIHIAGLVQFGSFSWINLIPESIVVGITNVDRKRDFTYPSKNKQDQKEFPTTGGSEVFIEYLEKEVQTLINKEFRTSESKMLIGQSLGGLLATEILFKKPDLFDHYLIISPSLWWDDESLLAIDPKPYSSSKSIYIGVGKEGEVMERLAKELFDKLEGIKAEKTVRFFQYFEKQDHGDVLHLAVYDAFEKLFQREKK